MLTLTLRAMQLRDRPDLNRGSPEDTNLSARLQRNLRGIWLALALTIAAAAVLYLQVR